MPISSHFQESSHVSSAIASTQTLSLPLSVHYCTDTRSLQNAAWATAALHQWFVELLFRRVISATLRVSNVLLSDPLLHTRVRSSLAKRDPHGNDYYFELQSTSRTSYLQFITSAKGKADIVHFRRSLKNIIIWCVKPQRSATCVNGALEVLFFLTYLLNYNVLVSMQ